jgi:hypothetical protein
MNRVECTRAEYKQLTGLTPDPWCVGAVMYGNGVPMVEYVYTDEPTPEDFANYRRATRALLEDKLRMPCVPPTDSEQIEELERLHKLASSPSTQSRTALTNGDGEKPSQSDPGQPDRS